MPMRPRRNQLPVRADNHLPNVELRQTKRLLIAVKMEHQRAIVVLGDRDDVSRTVTGDFHARVHVRDLCWRPNFKRRSLRFDGPAMANTVVVGPQGAALVERNDRPRNGNQRF